MSLLGLARKKMASGETVYVRCVQNSLNSRFQLDEVYPVRISVVARLWVDFEVINGNMAGTCFNYYNKRLVGDLFKFVLYPKVVPC